MKRLIFVICLLVSLSACKKEHVEPVNSPGVNTLPKKVVTHDSKDDAYKIQLYTYNSQGLVTEIYTYDSLTSAVQNVIAFTYNAKNQLIHKQMNFGSYVTERSYVYDSYGKIKTYGVDDTIYFYHYTAGGYVDYIIKKNTLMTYQDSIDIASPSAVTFKAKGQGTLGSTHDYLSVTIDSYVENDNGVYYYSGITNYNFSY